jgi:type I restriction-modification system DNA methylase subunit
MNTKQGQLVAAHLRPYLLQCGYSRGQLVQNVEVSNGHRLQIPLTAFAHYPHDSRSACIAVLDDVFDTEGAVRACRDLGAPLVFACQPDQLLFWKQTVTGPQLERRPIPLAEVPQFFQEQGSNLAPEAVYRAKTWARFDKTYQLSFVDLGLMPLVEEEAGIKLSELIERVVLGAKSTLGWKEVSQEQGQWLLQSNFWLLAAKILKDKNVPAFASLDLEDLEDVYAAVASHYGSSTPVPVSSEQQRLALRESAQEIARFSHLGLVGTEALAYLYERALITKETRIALGTHSTPGYLVEYIVGKLLPWINEMPASQRQVFEPACGHAAFLPAAMRLLGDLAPVNTYSPAQRHKYMQRRLHGNDQDTFALEIARLSLTLADVPNSNGWDLPPANVFRGNVLAGYARDADIVLANPPFGDFKADERRLLASQAADPKYVNKAAELLWQVVKEMKLGAVFGVVLPRGFLHDKNAASLRQYIATKFEIKEILLLPDNIFSISKAESTVILGRRSDTPNRHGHILYRRVRGAAAEEFKQAYIVTQDKNIQPFRFIKANQWSFFVPDLEEVWEFCTSHPKLKDIADSGQGFSFRSKESLPEGTITESLVPQEGLEEGFARLRKSLQTHELPDVSWFNMDQSAQFKITEQSVQKLRAESVGDDVVTEVERLKNREFKEKKSFLDVLKEVLGNELTVKVKTLILKYADQSVISRPRHGLVRGIAQVLLNYARVSYGPWRLKAFLDTQGHSVTSRFLVIRSEGRWPLEVFWAICNSPLANAYSYAFSTERDVLSGTVRNMPVPDVDASELTPLVNTVRVYLQAVQEHEGHKLSSEDSNKLKLLHWRIDAEVLRLYKLPPQLEWQLLDSFSGEKRRGVPFEQHGYFPKGFSEPLTLRELLAITADWEQTNERRTQLILKKVKKSISTEARIELDELQRLADCRIRLLAPLPIQNLEAIKEDLERRGMWQEN